MANKWFEETFLPSLEKRMTNPKYYNQCILTVNQASVCEKYMKSYRGEYLYTYDIGTKHYSLYRAGKYGKYYILTMRDSDKLYWFVRNNKTQENVATFKTEREMQDWIDQNVDEETGKINGVGTWTSWTTGCNYTDWRSA